MIKSFNLIYFSNWCLLFFFVIQFLGHFILKAFFISIAYLHVNRILNMFPWGFNEQVICLSITRCLDKSQAFWEDCLSLIQRNLEMIFWWWVIKLFTVCFIQSENLYFIITVHNFHFQTSLIVIHVAFMVLNACLSAYALRFLR